MINLNICYKNRFEKKDLIWKKKVWSILCKDYFQKFISSKDTVIDFGAGYCEFINNVKCRKKFAIDLNPDIKRFAKKNVCVFITTPDKLPVNLKRKINVVFISNFLEHLDSKDEVLRILRIVYELLSNEGKIIILQPNISLVKDKYWNFIDHKIALNCSSVNEALEISGFKKLFLIERFLPFQTKSGFPKIAFLIKIYLRLPSFLRLFAGQSLFVYTK